jgi:hypothetical protein
LAQKSFSGQGWAGAVNIIRIKSAVVVVFGNFIVKISLVIFFRFERFKKSSNTIEIHLGLEVRLI